MTAREEYEKRSFVIADGPARCRVVSKVDADAAIEELQARAEAAENDLRWRTEQRDELLQRLVEAERLLAEREGQRCETCKYVLVRDPTGVPYKACGLVGNQCYGEAMLDGFACNMYQPRPEGGAE